MIGVQSNSMRVPQQQSMQATTIPAPLRGMNASLSVAMDTQEYCLWAINILPSEYGLRVRKGYREWQIGMDEEVRTIITSGSKIFAACTDGIYDVTTLAGTPTLKVAFGTENSNSGFGTWINVTDASGDDFIYYADESNGLYKYTPGTDTWAAATGIQAASGSVGTLDEADIVFVAQHKLRIWFVERDTKKAWYLAVGAVTGDATEFFFGAKFKHGGDLVGLYNWTVDGGLGRDDHLIAISREGDVIPYTGEDPSDAMTWTSTGVFFIGRVPTGRKIAAEYGGELFMLSSFGLTTLSDLLRGGNPEDPFRDQIGYRVARLLREDVRQYGTTQGWQLSFATAQGALVISCPQRTDSTYRQYVYNLSTYGWGLWKGVPILCSETYDGFLMLGDKDGRVLRMDAGPDNVSLDGSVRTAISFFMLSSYLSMGTPAQFKRVKFIRPTFVGAFNPTYDVTAYYDFLNLVPNDATALPNSNTDVWDTGEWDSAVWSASDAYPFSSARGGSGIGRNVAVGISGAAYEDVYLASIDLAWDVGGFL